MAAGRDDGLTGRLGRLGARIRIGGLAAFLAVLTLLSGAAVAEAQVLKGEAVRAASGDGAAAEQGPPQLPETLTPETVDSFLARLTDSEIRDLVREELRARAASDAGAEQDEAAGLGAVIAQLGQSWARITRNVAARWDELGRLDERGPRVEARLALATNGVSQMIATALGLVFLSLAAAWVVHALTAPWRAWLKATDGSSYWDRVVRTLALTAVELAPVAAFAIAFTALAPGYAETLGPMLSRDISYVWIFEQGVANGWAAIVLSRRAFAPFAPQLRIADVSDGAARRIHRLISMSALIGMGAWLIAGLFPTFGLGFAPAIFTVAAGGSLVFALLLGASLGNFSTVEESCARAFGIDRPRGPATLYDDDAPRVGPDPQTIEGRAIDVDPADAAPAALAPPSPAPNAWSIILRRAAPIGLIVYLAVAYLYWLARWFETGQQHLVGPLGSLLVLLSLPALDRLGGELVRIALPAQSDASARMQPVLHGAWRVVLGFGAALAIAQLWGVDLMALAKGANAPDWASAVFDIAVTLLVGQLIWRLIQAALYQERHVAGGDLEDLEGEVSGPSRLQTLMPMFRIFLLMVLSIVVLMILLSSLGISIGPLLASAGIIGIAIGFGAQTLVRDIFSGMFFLIDDAFRVGEYIELDPDMRGEVEAISIRSLQLRHHLGPIITIPFGEMKSVTNHNRDWVIYKMPFRMEPDTDPVQVKKIVKRVGLELLEDPEHGSKFLEPLKSQGVLMVDEDSALIIRVKFKAKPRMQFVLRREVHHRLRTAFSDAGIKLARKKVEVVSSDGAAAGAAAAEAIEPPKPGGGLSGASTAQ